MSRMLARGARRLVVASLVAASTVVGAQNPPEQVYQPGRGVSSPRPVKKVKAQYTEEARRAKIEGVVVLNALVLSDGSVGDVSVARSLDAKLGLDQAAVAAAKQWVFEPGIRLSDRRPVACRVTIETVFHLKQ